MKIAKLMWPLAALCSVFISAAAMAAPNDYVISPIVEEGEKEIDFKWGVERLKDKSSATATAIGFGWGATSRWFTELEAKWHREPGERSGFDAWEWENRFQLTETGKYPIDLGLFLEIERPKDRSEGYELTYGPLLQKEWGTIQGNLNLLWEKHVRASEHFDTELLYQAQLRKRTSTKLDWGIQGFGALGRWDHWAPSSEQEHQFGPAIFGRIKTGTKQAVEYNAGLLFGITHASPRATLRVQAEYEF